MSLLRNHPDLSRRIRQSLGPHIDAVARKLGRVQYRIRPSEYVGTVTLDIADFEERLSEIGFEWDPVSLYHRTPSGTHTNGSWVYRSSRLADRQLHVILFAQARDQIDVYAHEEFSWIRHPLKHARHERIRREEGAREMHRVLDRMSVDYYHEPWPIRKGSHLLQRVRGWDRTGG
ncbi:hypothetical protein ACFQE8_18100 [Salinirubellus sp. GCM10025818]|uniref:hypothetical protein n=1 Tax=Salinirubellus TaxID=2162630 RepID=UPI0030CC09B2